MKSNNIAILILAAGEGKRFNGIKQLLPWGRSTIISNAIQTANKADISTIKVVLGANNKALLVELEKHNTNYCINPNWKNGMGSSIAWGINSIGDNFDAVLVMLCDQPLINTAYLNKMISVFNKGEKKIIATQYNNRPGVPALFGKKYFKVLRALSNDYGAKHVLEKNELDVIALNADGRTDDIDTVSDYKRLLNLKETL